MSSPRIGEHVRLRRARNQTTRHLDADDDPPLTHAVLPISQPNPFRNSAMSSFSLLPTSSNETTRKKPVGFPQTAPFRGMGCTAAAAQEVSLPSVIRSSADWDARIRKDKKKKKSKKKKNKGSYDDGSIRSLSEARDVDGGGCVAIPDVWCGPGLGFSTDAVVGPSVVDPHVVSVPPRRNLPSSRRKIDVYKNNSNQIEQMVSFRQKKLFGVVGGIVVVVALCYLLGHVDFKNCVSGLLRQSQGSSTLGSSVFPRRFLNQESDSQAFLNSDSTFMTSSLPEPSLLSSRYHSHLRRPYPAHLTETMMVRNGFVMARIADSRHHLHDLRLDVDNMSYEQLVELGDRIGYVNTGLKKSEIRTCLLKINPYVSHTLLADRKCSICQDEYEREAQVGKLDCGHSFHVQCVKQWLSRKNACPVCKKTAYVKP